MSKKEISLNLSETIKGGSRLFFVVDSKENNATLHETFLEALQEFEAIENPDIVQPRIRIALVNNAHCEVAEDGRDVWHYTNQSDTFTTIGVICQHNH